MGRIEKTVFICYRRTNFYTALAVYQDLTQHGYDVFIDYQSIDSGDFEKVILENIKAKAHFLVVLSPSALERCKEPGDWLRLEVETAIAERRNIIPLMMEGFDFGSPAVIQALSGKLAALNRFNGLRLYSDYFFDAMEKLRNRYLKVEVKGAHLQPLSIETEEITEANKSSASEAAQVETTHLTAEEWFERGYVFQDNKNLDEAFRCYSEAINLDPTLDVAYNNLGVLQGDLNRYEEAEAAYHKAVELNPSYTTAYNNLGNLLRNLKRYEEAEAAFRKAIILNPGYAIAYSNLGTLLSDGNLKRYEEAEEAYRQAIALNPSDAIAYNNLGFLLHKNTKRYDEAEAAYRKAIELNPSYTRAYNNLSLLLRLFNRFEEAIVITKKMIEIDPEDFRYYLDLVSISKQLGKKVSSKYLSKARQLMAEDDWYNLACLSSVCDDFDFAFEYLEKAAQRDNFDPAWSWQDPDLQWIRDDPRFVKIVGPKPK